MKKQQEKENLFTLSKDMYTNTNTNNESDETLNYTSGLLAVIGIGYLFPFSALTQPVRSIFTLK